jgi:Ran GTPase-activating protein (RanGAP) involved in mRNA processing and transport
LDLRKNPIGDSGVTEIASSLKYSNSMVHVDFSSNELTAKGGRELFKALRTNESIISVDISSHEGLHRNHLGERGVKKLMNVLKTNKILTILNLSGNGIKVEGLSYITEGLSKNNTLLSLKISQNEIIGSPQSFACLKSLIIESKLIELDISDNPLGNPCIESIAQVIGGAGTSLKKLYIANVGITCNKFD